MFTGLPPFYTTNRDELFDRIKYSSLKYPDRMSSNLKNMLMELFEKDPNKRLGGSLKDALEIKDMIGLKILTGMLY